VLSQTWMNVAELLVVRTEECIVCAPVNMPITECDTFLGL
jgi:hypothetical protein